MRRPFTLYKEKGKSGTFWYARFWDEAVQKNAHSRSTQVPVEGKKERRYEAEEAARKIYNEIASSLFSKSKAPVIQKPKIEQPTPVLLTAVGNTPLVQYLEYFWSSNSEYAKFKRDVEKKPLTPYYIEMNHDDVRRHVQPFPGFNGVTVGTLNKAILKKYLIWLAGRKTQRRKKDGSIVEGDTMSSRRANAVLQSVRVAIRWAFDNEEIQVDPFHKLGEVTESIKEKGVLSLEERNTLIDMPIQDHRIRLVLLLGCLCGLRRGEIRGLQWGDISDGLIHVQHNYQDQDGLKMPKYNSVRKVPVPAAVQTVLDIAKEKVTSVSPNNFILESPDKKHKGLPVSNNFFRNGVVSELAKLGISESQQKERVLTCHSMRHTFVTLAQLSGIPDVVISALVGHKMATGNKSAPVTQKYSHVPQVINFDEARAKIDNSYLVKKSA
jgi:integrase